ncbi:hypothetical protein [Chryseobacterium sp. 2R14A]|uniref:hypothetical protein n=1 Tax=Chryseobacterium sp. 2R14A TaxID=3380353 RepID=UPI003CEAAF9B
MKKLISLFFLLFINLFNCQYAEGQYTESEIYKLKLRIEKGDKKALYELAPYFDSSRKLAEFLGYHYLETQESFLAKRAIAENTTFTNQEMNVDSISSSKQFLDFLKKNERKINTRRTYERFILRQLTKEMNLLHLGNFLMQSSRN